MTRLSRSALGALVLAGAIAGCHAEWHAGGPASAAPGTAAPGGEVAPTAEAPAATTAPRATRVAQPADPGPAAATTAPDPVTPDPGATMAPATTGTVDLACQFSDGWIAVVPRRVYRPNEDGLMQALIGFATDPSTWGGQPAWSRYSNFPAHQCGVDPLHLSLEPGSYVVLVGKKSEAAAAPAEGEGDEGPEEVPAAQGVRNGRIERISVRTGQTVSRSFVVQMMNHTWSGI